MTSREVEAALAHDAPRSREEWGWNWSEVKRALEWLFWSGQVASAGRTTQFERRYAALDRVAPAPHRAAWAARGQDRTETEAIVELVRIASRAMGIATEASLADYFRLTRAQARTAIADLLREGTLQEVSVPGWRDTAYLDSRARIPRKVHVAALVSPFDSLVWHRPRTEALFGVRYRIEIYTPAPAADPWLLRAAVRLRRHDRRPRRPQGRPSRRGPAGAATDLGARRAARGSPRRWSVSSKPWPVGSASPMWPDPGNLR
jgi:uncharacterized protein YcaQ